MAGYALDPIDEGIVWNYRLTRALVAAACGAGLATCGVILQSLLRNPLADPYLLGISAGASTGAVLVALLGLGAGRFRCRPGRLPAPSPPSPSWCCWARAGGSPGNTGQIILAGIAGSQLFNALTAFLITKSASSEQARGIMFWLLGNLSGVRWPSVVAGMYRLRWPASLGLPVAPAGTGCLHLRRGLRGLTRHRGTSRAISVDQLRRPGDGGDGVDCRLHRFRWTGHSPRRQAVAGHSAYPPVAGPVRWAVRCFWWPPMCCRGP